jgi:hypothetical protein
VTTAYQKRRNKDRKHAALMKRDPSLREQLYGPPTPYERRLAGAIIDAAARETAKKEP